MKSKTMKLCRVGVLAGLSALTALLVACGDDVTNTDVTNVTGAKTVADLAAAGACNADATGEIVLNSEDGALYVCNGKKWITMKGDAGETGEPGAPGNPGAAGTSCEATSIAGVGIEVSCGGVIVDTLKNGAKGDPGDPGDAGTSCEATSIAGVGIEISCDGVPVDTLKNGAAGTSCEATSIAGVGVEITCGGVVIDTVHYVLPCGGIAYSTATHFCDERDTSLYEMVRIGSQTWMKTNLHYDYKKGNASYGSYCYNNSADSCAKYGRLYTWAAAMDTVNTGCGYGKTCAAATGRAQGICPDGWHMPDSTEWETLYAAVGGKDSAGEALKAAQGWSDNGNGDDSYGFAALPAGQRSSNGTSQYVGNSAYFWYATEAEGNYGKENAYYVTLYKYNNDVSAWEYQRKNVAFSVRCVKNSD